MSKWHQRDNGCWTRVVDGVREHLTAEEYEKLNAPKTKTVATGEPGKSGAKAPDKRTGKSGTHSRTSNEKQGKSE